MGNFIINEKASCYLNIAVLATILSIGLLWKEYVILGLVTFIYAVAAHLTDTFFHSIWGEKKNKLLIIVEILLFLLWIFLLSILLS